MKITDVQILRMAGVHANWIFVKLTTDTGITGYGESSIERHEEAVITAIESFREFLIGANPFNVELIWNSITKSVFWEGGVVIQTALSGVEQALWDIKGKALDVPVYELLGGKLRDRMRAYANAWSSSEPVTHDWPKDSPKTVAENASKMVQAGFRSIKWDPFRNAGQVVDKAEENYAVDCVQAVREAVGPDVELLIECHGRFNIQSAIRLAQKLEPFDPFFYEEPVPPDNVEAMAEVQRSINFAVATGERLYTRWAFRPLLERQAARIIQPDVCHCGGIWELKKIAAMAEAHYVTVQPHNANGPIATLASLHVDATIPNFIFQEFFYPYLERYNELLTEPIKYEDGSLHLPESPGLGADIREEVVAKYPPMKPELLVKYIGSYW